MDEKEELAYKQGSRTTWSQILQECLMQLGYDDQVVQRANYITEREGAITQLRELCRYFGDNDWDENLHLADIIEKHLARHLWSTDVKK